MKFEFIARKYSINRCNDASVTYTPDALHRVATSVDSRTGTTSFTSYTESGNVLSMTEPGSRTTTFSYDVMGRRMVVGQPNTTISGGTSNNITQTSYYKTGKIKAVWGDQTYAIYRIYNSARGELSAKHTRYDYRSGYLVAKRYFTSASSNTGSNAGNDTDTGDVGYSYDAFGRTQNIVSTANRPGTRILNLYVSTSTLSKINELQTVDPDIRFTVGTGEVSVDYGSINPSILRWVHRNADSLLRFSGVGLRLSISNTSNREGANYIMTEEHIEGFWLLHMELQLVSLLPHLKWQDCIPRLRNYLANRVKTISRMSKIS
ncbi:RHS repeat protein [Luteolibacter pohnpeiensis]|uniref:RHS repeat protein n=1 Tax=Luteolibacter pohnpeiensis TaxID=454153 RepID=A0A934VY86_9BACT|nr:RHS repeat domain-containing protein [Luteolibacter pohnpeiensis]MBK1884299.1 RHS repeat protein [Luteolibacter pohnpeiensis]